jgi:two-component system phosphate regulon sensor histidine kinase PhoR
MDIATGLVLFAAAGLAFALGVVVGDRRGRGAGARPAVEARASGADAERELVAAMAATVSEAVLVTDARQRVRYANDVAHAWFAIDLERAPALMSIVRSAELRDLIGAVDDDEIAELALAHRDRVYRARMRRLGDGGAAICLRDDTEIEKLARARRDLVANISHDLRTPLTSIRMLVESLLQPVGASPGGPDPERRRATIASIQDQAGILERLADDLIQLNQIESGRALLQLSAHRVADIVDAAVRAIEPQLIEREIDLRTCIPGDAEILVDGSHIVRVLTNLLDNAVKASRPGRTVVVGCESGPGPAALATSKGAVASGPAAGTGSAPDHVQIFVQDEGPGIAPDDAERIFERFYRGDRARSSGGTGLGLAIARHIVEGHGGRIWLDRGYRDGARFCFTVPLAE